MKFTNGFKRFTKKMSAVLAAALSVSAITVPQVFAAKVNNMPESYTWQNRLYENFENIADVDGLSNSSGFGIQSDATFTPQFMTVSNTNDEHNKAIGLMDVKSGSTNALSPGFYYSLPAKVASGEVKISFSIKSQQLSAIPIYLMQEPNTPGESLQQIITFNENNLYTFQGSNFGYTADKWVDVTIVANLDNKTFNIVFSGEGIGNGTANEKKYVRYDDKALTIDGLSGIQFRSWIKKGEGETYTYFDNIKIATKQYTGTNDAYIKEDFSNIDSFNEVFADDWVWTHDQKTVDGKIVNVDESHGKALQLSQNGPGVYTSLKDKNGNAFSSGKYEVKFSIYPKDEKTKIYVDMNDVILCYFDEYNGLGRSTSVAGEARYSAGKWYDVSAVMNLAEQKGTVVVTQGDTTVWTKDFTYDKNVFSQLRIRSWNDKAFYIDDIMVKDYVEPKPSTVLIDENFDNMTELSNGWENMNNNNPVSIIENDSYGKSAKAQFVGSSGLQKSFDAVTGKFKISFLMSTNTQFYLNLINKNAAGEDKNQALAYIDTSFRVHSGNGDGGHYIMGNVESGKYYQFEFVVDTDNKTYEMSYTDVATSTKSTQTLDSEKLPRLLDLNSVSGIQLGFWDSKKDGSDTVIIDNVKVERIVTAPVLSAETVAIKDYNENVITDTTKVTPAISEIALNFGTQIDEATLDGAITLTDSNNSAVAFDYALSSDGKIVTITPTAYLKGGKTYSLSVAKTVANVYDMAMDAAFNMQFETAADFAKAELTTLPKLSDITTGSTVTIGGNFINCTDSSKNLVW
ncbi:MAG: Ig-like domain-containing protein, partial [Eubacteriales bacterium]|nr:Ig-like domain-containing protein [Eubacteriales bacterium]